MSEQKSKLKEPEKFTWGSGDVEWDADQSEQIDAS
jgi:hypothetical protein